MDKLSDAQLSAFDLEMVPDSAWAIVQRCIDRDFPEGVFSFVDVGGGNGVFADRVLRAYPNARGAVLDSSTLLLSRNTIGPRKTLIHAEARELPNHCNSVDIIFCNWLLHHLVTTGRYRTSRHNIATVIKAATQALSKRGRLSIFEYAYNGFIDNLPGRLIFEITSIKALAPITQRLGANTAGVGVCFLSLSEWRSVLLASGVNILELWFGRERRIKLGRRVQLAALLVKSRGHIHLWGNNAIAQ